jgi:dTDP-glucose 4,6-dehydratase
MRVLVTGGAGFIGSTFVNMAIADKNFGISEVIVLDKLTYAGNLENLKESLGDSKVQFFHGDINDVALVNQLTSRVDAIINFAAESHVDNSILNSKEFVNTNVLGTHTLLEAARLHSITKFIQISTDEVYGSIVKGSWDESSPLLPNSPYSASKAAADLLVRSYAVTHGLNVNITRCSNNFGPSQNIEKAIPNFLQKIASGKEVEVYGDGENVRDWLYVKDHCSAISLVLNRGEPGEIYNIGGGTEISNNDLVTLLHRQMGVEKIRFKFVPDRPGHDRRYSVNWLKINQLGYVPQYKFEVALMETVEWFRGQYE